MTDFGPGLVTVFGGSGFVGTQVVRALAKRGWRVRAAVRKPHLAGPLRPLGDIGQIQAVRCDVTRRADVEAALAGADAAINLVGILFEGGGRKFQSHHVEAARHIAELARDQGLIRLVQVSAIGAEAKSPSAYARSKGQAEEAVRKILPEAVIVRPSLIFGPGDGFLNRFASLAATAPALPLIGGGQTRFQPVYVGDVGEAVARALVRRDAAGRTFELGGPEVMTFEEVLRYILKETNRRRALVPLPFGVAKAIGAVAQLTAVLGVPPQLTEDQVELLKRDNVVGDDAGTLQDLGIDPTGMEAIAPQYLWRYRPGGQFAERPGYAPAVA